MYEINGKRILITGATSGVGKETAKALAAQGANLIIIARNVSKSKKLSDEIAQISNKNPAIYIADLSLMQEVKNATQRIKADFSDIDILINNAGLVMGDRKETKEGFEYTLAVNHLAPFLLTRFLLPLLEKRAETKIINVASEAHKMGNPNLHDFNYQNSKFKPMRVYGDTKLYNILFTKKLAAILQDKNTNPYCLHPGFVNSSFGHNLGTGTGLLLFLMRPFMINAKKGAHTTMHVVNLPFDKNDSGLYFKNSKPKNPSKMGNDKQLADELWLKTEEVLKPWL